MLQVVLLGVAVVNEEGYVSVTALYTSLLDKPPQRMLKKLCADVERELIGVY